MVTVPLRILSLLLCLLIAGPMSTPAWALARPETRVGKFFSSPLQSAPANLDQTLEPRGESRSCGYDFASGVCKYLYAQADPVNGVDPSGHDLVSTMSTMTIGTAIGMWSTIAANHALGRAQTYSSILMGGAFGAAMGPLAVAIPEIGVGLGIYGMAGSGGIVYQTFSNPNATPSQKAAAVGLVVASIWGTKVAIKYSNAMRVAPPAENVPAPGIPTFPLPLRSPPGVVIKSMAQNGLDGQKVGQLPGLISSMIEGKPIPYIAGMRNGNTYWINEGHTRMTAALELFNKTGDSSHVMKLLNEGNWKTGTPSTDIQMTSE